MKSINFLFCICFLFGLVSCKKDCQDTSYQNYTVDFFTTHKDFEVIPATFDTVYETVIAKEAHLEGAVFETVTEQVLIKEGYNKYYILDSMLIQIPIDEETNNTTEFYCYHFLDSTEIVSVQIPSQYMTITSQRVVQQGTGMEVSAEYATITNIILDTPPQFNVTTKEQKFKRMTFRIPEKRTIRGHLNYYFDRQSVENCREGNSYKILD